MQKEGNHSKQRKPNVQSLRFGRVWYVLDVAGVWCGYGAVRESVHVMGEHWAHVLAPDFI